MRQVAKLAKKSRSFFLVAQLCHHRGTKRTKARFVYGSAFVEDATARAAGLQRASVTRRACKLLPPAKSPQLAICAQYCAPHSVFVWHEQARGQALGYMLWSALRLGDLRKFRRRPSCKESVRSMPDQIQPGAAFVVGRDDVPGRPGHVGGLDHSLVGYCIIPPAPH